MKAKPATAALIAWACEARDDWDSDQLRAAFATAANDGMAHARAVQETVRLVFVDDATPRDLPAASRSPLARSGTKPGDYATGAARARAALSSAGDDLDAA